jgi:hypothetical protein
MFHTEDPQTSGTTIKHLVAMATWCRGFLHPWSKGELFEFLFIFLTPLRQNSMVCPEHFLLSCTFTPICRCVNCVVKPRNQLRLLWVTALICMLFQIFCFILHLLFLFVAEHPCWQHVSSGSGWVGHEWKRQQSGAFCHEVVCRAGSWWGVCYSNCVQYPWTA